MLHQRRPSLKGVWTTYENWAPANNEVDILDVVEAGGLLEAALQAVHGLEEALEAGKALGAEAGGRQVQQLLSAQTRQKFNMPLYV
jgi:hypothetical protein